MNGTESNALLGLFAALCLGKKRRFLMLVSYTDDTGHSKDPNRHHIGLGGLLADSEKWTAFDAMWRLVCKEEGVVLPFDMKSFAAKKKGTQFADPKWADNSKRTRLMKRLVDVIDSTEALPIGAIVDVPDFRSLSAEQQSGLGGPRKEPYQLAFQSCTNELVRSAIFLSDVRDGVSMVYSIQAEHHGFAGSMWRIMQAVSPLGSFMIGSFTEGTPLQYTPLQAADLWAYELGHHFNYIIPNDKPWRKSFTRLVAMATSRSPTARPFTYYHRERMLGMEDGD